MNLVQKTISSFALSHRCRQHVFPFIAVRNYCAEKEKPIELKLSYLTGEQKGIAVIELNREKGKNSFSRSLTSKLLNAVDVLGHDKNVRVVIIRCDYKKNIIICDFNVNVNFQESRQGNFLCGRRFERTSNDDANRSHQIREFSASAHREH